MKYELYSPKTNTKLFVKYKDDQLVAIQFETESNPSFWEYIIKHMYNPTDLMNTAKKYNYKVTLQEQNITFEMFWDTYAHKFGKKEARDKWKKLTKKEQQQAVSYIKNYNNELARSGVAKKHPKTYLHQKIWKE